MTNPKPNNVSAERDALQRENEQLRREYNRLSDQTKAIEEILARAERQNARLRAKLEDLAQCETCGDACARSPINNAYPPRYCHGCYHKLAAELEAARKVADAAVHYFNVDTDRADWDALAFNALDAAVREYRKLKEEA